MVTLTIIDVLEIILLVPILIAIGVLGFRSANEVLGLNKLGSLASSILIPAIIGMGLKHHMMKIVLLPSAVLGTIVIVIKLMSFIVALRNKTQKRRKR
ncbi:MAG: hypothetical protein A2Y10_13820 [Planctomycetes bacterium GWF2_41_51]|nr:MAG: hypothetical protein A2Y10_13820 [Planctomycetes bacterium GWF2_41_51]HBG25972.1 hypothetical protein [Phycisphaerales bacterium]